MSSNVPHDFDGNTEAERIQEEWMAKQEKAEREKVD
jgi:cytochrome c oxidase subunit 1